MFPILHHPPWWRWLHPLQAHSPGEPVGVSRWESGPSQDTHPRIWGAHPSAHPVPHPAPPAAQACPRSRWSSTWSSPWQRPRHCQTDPLQRQEGSMGGGDTPVPALPSSDSLTPIQPVPRWCQYRGHRKIPLLSCSPSPGQCSASATPTGSEETRPLPPAGDQHPQPPAERPRSCPTAPPWSCTQTPQGDLGPSLCHPEFLQEIQDHPWVTQGPFKKPCTRPGTPRAPAQETQARQNSPLTHLLWRTAASRA